MTNSSMAMASVQASRDAAVGITPSQPARRTGTTRNG